MRTLIADRNARLLKSIACLFAGEFAIQTATTLEHCAALLLRGDFDLVIVSEKLADGPGLRLLGQIARDSPDTLRVFAARRSHLELLRGRLGVFGLFRTLSYPIEAQKLLATLTLARAGLEVGLRIPKALPVPLERQPADERPASGSTVSVPLHAQPARVTSLTPAGVRAILERIRNTSGDAILATNVPLMIMAPGVRCSNMPRVIRPRPVAARIQLPAPAPALPKVALPRTLGRRSSQPRAAGKPTLRPKLLLGAAVAGAFLVTLILKPADVHLTRAPASGSGSQLTGLSVPLRSVAPVSVTPLPTTAWPEAQRLTLTRSATTPVVPPEQPETGATATALADPSTFGSEAYEPIYSN